MEVVDFDFGLVGNDFDPDLGPVSTDYKLDLRLIPLDLVLLVFYLLLPVSSTAGLSPPAVTVSGVQSVAFASPSSPAHGPPSPALAQAQAPVPVPAPAPALAPASAPQSPSLSAARTQVCLVGPGLVPESSGGTEVVQQRLDQTSTSLEAALKAVERKLNLEDNSDG